MQTSTCRGGLTDRAEFSIRQDTFGAKLNPDDLNNSIWNEDEAVKKDG
jgi:hypothetical protein